MNQSFESPSGARDRSKPKGRPVPALLSAVASLLLTALPAPAFAHPGPHVHDDGLWHLLTQPDHLALLALAVGLGVGLARWLGSRRTSRAASRESHARSDR
ncbi:MAG: hypothetical protein R3E87_00255 [Burkholderiaceae bacterium]